MTEEQISVAENAASAVGPEDAMHIHRPKPLHGFREIAVEIGVIVVGVVIALLAEQTVTSVEWAHKVDIANKALTQEIAADDGPEVYQRAAMDRCLIGKLDAIESGVDRHLDRQAMLALIRSYQILSVNYDTQQRDAVNSSGVAVHIPERQFSDWQQIYSDIPTMDRAADQEARDLGQLYALRGGGGPLSDAEEDRVFTAAETLRADEKVMFSAARWTLPHIFRAGLRLDPARVAYFMGWAREHYQNCLSDVPMDWDGRALTPIAPR